MKLAISLTIGVALAAQVTAGAQQPEAPRPAGPLEYVVGPGDVLNVFVWKEPELTRDVTVRFDGRITAPLLGDVEAAGRTPQQLGTEIAAKLARFLSAPQVAVGVAQANSTRFYVIGQVNKPGDFPLIGNVSLVQALAIAGGFKEFAKSDSIVVIRRDKGTETAISVNYKRIESSKELGQNIPLRPGDTIVVP